jgi:predicted alpha-1,2-mannosidase
MRSKILPLLKWFFIMLAGLLCMLAVIIGGFWWKYRSFVDAPGLSVPEKVSSQYPLAAKVNPFIGTGGIPWTCAYNFPGVSLPFGMMRLSPETASMLTNDTGLNTSGYFYGDNKMIGFSHTRLSGTGAIDGGHFLVQPVAITDKLKENPSALMYHYSHQNELAYPGYYSIELPVEKIKVELTGTERVGIHRYTFQEAENPGILLDITHALGNKRSEDGSLHIRNNREIEGHVRTFGSFAGRYGGIKVYFAAKFSSPSTMHRVWINDEQMDQKASYQGDQLLSYFEFDAQTVVLKLAISHVSIENARENLKMEAGEKSFDAISKEASQIWQDRLSSIEVFGGTNEQQVNFYTALYRSFQMPTVFNDANGQYMGFDKSVHQVDGFRYFTDMSIWDTFRTVHPLYTLIAPDDQQDMIRSLVQMARQGGWLPRWPSGNGYTNSMLGSAADIVISEAYQKGIRDFDVAFAYQNMKEIALHSTPEGAAFSGREGNDACLAYGYCPADSMDEAVSRSLEFAWSDHAIGQLAGELGLKEDAQMFQDLSMNYKNVWNPETQFFHPRNANGEFVKDFEPLMLTYVDNKEKYTNDYVEGSAMQWRWAPFFDAKGLIGLFKSKAYFTRELDAFFSKADPEIGHWYPGSYYWHGNEPDIHAPYLFNYAGRPDLTQKWVRWILDNKYTNRYDGLDGNDDGGTLSAWYIFSSLGFYPVAGTTTYQLGAPLFESATINLGHTQLEILAKNYSPENIYVKKVTLNGLLLDRTWISHQEIADGGQLVFEMTNEPLNY